MKLREVANNINQKNTPDHVSIEEWLRRNNVKRFTIQQNGIIDVDANVNLESYQETTLPYQFGKVTGHFYCYGSYLASFENFPSHIGGTLHLYNSHIYSFHGINHAIKYVGGNIDTNDTATHILGMLLIDGLQHVVMDDGGPIDVIMNKYVRTGDIISAQDELIDAGFKAQARL
jgi:hypothetical protein